VHASPTVQASPSLHGLFTGSGVWSQVSVASLQLSVVHVLVSAQLRGPVGVHVPPTQRSPTVQKSVSSQVVPSARLGWVQRPPAHTSVVHWLPSSVHGPVMFVWTQPVAELQLSVVHSWWSSQFAGGPGTQVPDASHASPTVQASLSVQAVPGVTLVWSQVSVASLHVSVVQEFASLHDRWGPAVHVPD
jgi:hypothetical protein